VEGDETRGCEEGRQEESHVAALANDVHDQEGELEEGEDDDKALHSHAGVRRAKKREERRRDEAEDGERDPRHVESVLSPSSRSGHVHDGYERHGDEQEDAFRVVVVRCARPDEERQNEDHESQEIEIKARRARKAGKLPPT
jgi:hypothetical protein